MRIEKKTEKKIKRSDAAGSGTVRPILWTPINIIRRNKKLYYFAKGLRSVGRNGIQVMAKMISAKTHTSSSLKTEIFLMKAERLAQEETVFPEQIKISIITCLFNTPEDLQKETIESVIAQTYGDWELCLVCAAGQENAVQLCESHAQGDPRIKYRIAEGCVAEALNSAIEMSSGEYIGILKPGDLLHPSALFEVMTAMSDTDADFIYTDEAFFSDNTITLRNHKPGYAVDTLRSCNYIGNFIVFSRTLMNRAGLFRNEFNECYDYDLVLRYSGSASGIYHIPKLLYFRRRTGNEPPPPSKDAIMEQLKRCGIPARVEDKYGLPGFYRVIYELTQRPLVSIIIPNKDNITLLRNCIISIMEKTTYDNYEIIIVENNSVKDATFAYYEELKRYPCVSIAHWEGKEFNYSEICNFGVQHACGRQLVFMNNDVVMLTPNWIEEMLMYSQRDDVGTVGIKLYFVNGSIQHAGVVLGMGGIAGHVYLGTPYYDTGQIVRLQIARNLSAVTAACMMIRRSVFEEAGCFSPEFQNSFNDVDLCLKIRKAGYLVVWTPYAEAFHLESKSRGYYTTSRNKRKITEETALFRTKWKQELEAGDPYYNCNFSLDRADYALK